MFQIIKHIFVADKDNLRKYKMHVNDDNNYDKNYFF